MRGKQAPKRKIKPDTRYNSVLVAKFINYIMKAGKKTVAQNVVYTAFDLVEEKIKAGKVAGEFTNGLEVFEHVVKTISPQLEVRGRRVGGANYQVPYPVRGDRKIALAYRWIIEAARSKKGGSMAQHLANEFLSVLEGEGASFKKRNDVQRMAEANRAFAHFAR